jgi:arabinose-5-phosphate isomerase
MAHFYCMLPVQKELCPFDLAPTISTEVQLLFGDALAIVLMHRRGFGLSQYSENHPAGTIGKKTTLKVSDLMLHGEALPTCHTTDRLGAVLSELSDKKCGCLIVVDKDRAMRGIFTDGDLRRSLQTQNLQVLESRLEELMTRSALAISKDALAWDAMKLMQKDPKKWIMVLPVLEEGRLVGLLRMHDIIHAGIA